MSAPTTVPTPHAVIPRDGWYDGPHVCAFMQGGQITAIVFSKSCDAYDLTRATEAGAGPLWIGRAKAGQDDVRKMVEEYFAKNGNGAA